MNDIFTTTYVKYNLVSQLMTDELPVSFLCEKGSKTI